MPAFSGARFAGVSRIPGDYIFVTYNGAGNTILGAPYYTDGTLGTQFGTNGTGGAGGQSMVVFPGGDRLIAFASNGLHSYVPFNNGAFGTVTNWGGFGSDAIYAAAINPTQAAIVGTSTISTLYAYRVNSDGSRGTAYANPTTGISGQFPSNGSWNAVGWSPDNTVAYFGDSTTSSNAGGGPAFFYAWNDSTGFGTRYSTAGVNVIGTFSGAAWHPNSTYVNIVANSSTNTYVWPWTGSSLGTAINTSATTSIYTSNWSPDGSTIYTFQTPSGNGRWTPIQWLGSSFGSTYGNGPGGVTNLASAWSSDGQKAVFGINNTSSVNVQAAMLSPGFGLTASKSFSGTNSDPRAVGIR